MKFVLFYHSLVSDWNHGNAHFLRGVCSELLADGHRVAVYEPANGWSLRHLLEDQGPAAVRGFHTAYPELVSHFYTLETLDLERALDGADVVVVHEWNEPELVASIGRHLAGSNTILFFHDTHHRVVSDPEALRAFDLRHYDGVLAFGDIIRHHYLQRGWTQRAWTWHEAADTRRFHPLNSGHTSGDLVWIGNWGDEERSRELHEFLIEPVAALKLRARIHGVRYPDNVKQLLATAGIDYGGWLPNYRVPDVFAQFRCTVHVPRRAYSEMLPGIPTIRIFEALACGIPLISAPWDDCERLFRPGMDYLVARTGTEMRDCIQSVLHDPLLAAQLALHGRTTLMARHTCAHRVAELLTIVADVRGGDGHLKDGHLKEVRHGPANTGTSS